MLGTLIRLILPRAGQPVVLVLVAMLLAGPPPSRWLGRPADGGRDGRGQRHLRARWRGQHRCHLYDRDAGQDRPASGADGGGADALGLVPYLLLWIGFVAGASLGALSYAQWGVAALWGAVMAALAAAAAAWTLSRAA